VYGEATATLAGDALLTAAFEIICAAPLAAETRISAVRILAEAAGSEGMVGGQIMDLAAEDNTPSFETLVKTHSLKTGAMIKASITLGLLAAGVTDESVFRNMSAYAQYIGLAFQIVDDLLDVVGDEATLGKPVGSDAEAGKTTFMNFLSLDEARQYARELTERAKEAISQYENGEDLCALADYLLAREN
jgi:geranylgeranyl diphosphate synthase type II